MKGFYSATQAQEMARRKVPGRANIGFVVWTKPNGEYAICTAVGDKPPKQYPDAIDLGAVVDCVYPFNAVKLPTSDPRVDQHKFWLAYILHHSKHQPANQIPA